MYTVGSFISLSFLSESRSLASLLFHLSLKWSMAYSRRIVPGVSLRKICFWLLWAGLVSRFLTYSFLFVAIHQPTALGLAHFAADSQVQLLPALLKAHCASPHSLLPTRWPEPVHGLAFLFSPTSYAPHALTCDRTFSLNQYIVCFSFLPFTF